MSAANEGQSHTEELEKIWRDFWFWCSKFVLIAVFVFVAAYAGIEIYFDWRMKQINADYSTQSGELNAEQKALWEKIY